MSRFLLILLLLITDCFILSAQTGKTAIRIMFYNVENAFDIIDDTANEDNDFLPSGSRHWNKARYEAKINSIYKVITAAGDWKPPEIIGMCEVENRRILSDLVSGTYLSKFRYGIVHEESPDRRGIDVCMIYNPEAVTILQYRYLVPQIGGSFHSRSILYSMVRAGIDTIHLFLNHWPSRTGGVLAGDELRHKLSALIKQKIDSLQSSKRGKSKIVIAGDFNSTPDDSEVKLLVSGSDYRMINLSAAKTEAVYGTYRYKGVWEMLDQILVSAYFKECRTGLKVTEESFKIFKPDFLLVKDPRYPGFMPFSTYRGYRYQYGFSDHLPVVLTLFPLNRD